MVRVGRIVLQQSRQRGSPGLQQGRSQTHLDRLQIELALLVSLVNHSPQEAFYFAGEFLLDRLRRFFPGRSVRFAPRAASGRSSDSHRPIRRRESGTCETRRPVDFLRELKMRTVSGVIGFGAMTRWTTAAPGRIGDGTWLKVSELGNLAEQSGSVVH
jgi:hypothetical protein